MRISINASARCRTWLRNISIAFLVAAFAAGACMAQDKAKKLPPPAKPFDINTATFDQFHSLPGVGPVTAQRILDFRKKSGPFQRVEDLLAVRGISQGRLEKIRQYVMVKPESAQPKASTGQKPAPPKAAPPPPKKAGS